MSLHLIIDGYNLIRRSPTLSALDKEAIERGRSELIRRLAAYKRMRSLSITVVFDGWIQGDLSESRTTQKGIRVVFSRRGQKADQVIIRKAREMGEKAMVVTSDREVQHEAEHCRTTVVSCEEFESRMGMAVAFDGEEVDTDDFTGNSERKGTEKKGPSRRLPKSMRRTRRRIKKL